MLFNGAPRSKWETSFIHSGMRTTLRTLIVYLLKKERSTYQIAKEAEIKNLSLEELISKDEVKTMLERPDIIDRLKNNQMLMLSYKETSARAMHDFYRQISSFAQAFLAHSPSGQRQLAVQEAQNGMNPEPKQPCLSSLTGSETLLYMISRTSQTIKL
ncbi:MAG: hypothetical protein KKC80_06190 [Candidatus Margulisbacteria bacterium]|nr:hypothetical protein [Candidatus Margulisiibacteriota bacterium]